MDNILLSICCLSSLFYLSAVLFLFQGLRKLSPGTAVENLSYSVIIAARNEDKNLPKCLDSILRQTIPSNRYEIIVVNDRSTDATESVCGSYAAQFANVKFLTIKQTPAGVSPKKYAVGQGIVHAQHEIVVFTDADCIVGQRWLEKIGTYFTTDTAVVQGVTTYFRTDDIAGWLFGFQAVDFLSHGVVAAAAIGAGMPINSNANNFAFRKDVYQGIGGYGEAERVVSGDDDLLLQRIHRTGTWRIRFMVDPEGAVKTAPTPTLKGVIEQRKRWGSKTVHYNVKQVVFLSGIFLFYVMLLLSFCIAPFKPLFFVLFAAMFLVKSIGEFLLMVPGTRIFDQKELRRYILPSSIFQLLMVVFAVVAGVFGRFNWKGQQFSRVKTE